MMLVLRTMDVSRMASTGTMNEPPIYIHRMLNRRLGCVDPAERNAITLNRLKR